MIPLPPHDPGLPGLRAALDGEAMQHLLAPHLGEIDSCRPSYVRYKPGTSCLVQYDLRVRDGGTGAVVQAVAHIRLFADGRAAALRGRPSVARLVERAARRHPQNMRARFQYVPDLEAVLLVYPVDLELRGLVRATSAGKMRRVLGARRCRPALVRYKPARKALLRYELEGGERRAVYGKLYARGAARGSFEAARGLAGAGVPTPAPLAYLGDFGMVLLAEAEGVRLADLREDPDFEDWVPAVAAALARLHAMPVPRVLPFASPAHEVSALLATARTIAKLLPESAAEVASLSSAVADGLGAVPAETAAVHGDFYDDQLLVSDAGVVMLDFDEARAGHPLLDAANFAAHVSARLPGARAEAARRTFLECYAERRPYAQEHADVFEAAALLKLAVAPFRKLEPDWPEGMRRTLRLARERLGDRAEAPWRARRAAPPRDPALPQLEALLDPRAVGAALEGVYREPTKVAAVRIVRHKPGRRCTLRYDVRIGGGEGRSERLYGKTFATGRGRAVAAALATINAARPGDPAVALPQLVAYLAPLGLLVQREVPGRPIADDLLAGDEGLARRVAEALHDLHAARVTLPRRHSLAAEVEPLRARTRRLSAVRPALASGAARCLELVERSARRPWPWRWRPIHRDFYYDQLLAGAHGVSILDLDDAAMSEPAVDVANFVAHLRLLGLQAKEESDALAGVGRAFVRRYGELDRDLDPALVRFLAGATLLRLAEIHLVRPRGAWIAPRLLAESEAVLASAA